MSKSEMVACELFGPYKGVKTIDLTWFVDADFVAAPSDRDTVEVGLYGPKATSLAPRRFLLFEIIYYIIKFRFPKRKEWLSRMCVRCD